MNTVEKISREQIKQDNHPDFVVGDTIKVHYKIKEGGKERIQVYTGTVIARKGGGVMESVTVRRISYGEGVERVFPLNSPNIDKIEIDRHGKVRRAKLYYLRDLAGKKARIKERRV
jgi:large subunit ribosomal protein L19